MKRRKNNRANSFQLQDHINLIIRGVSFISLIPVILFSTSRLFPYFHESEKALFVRDPYFLLSLSVVFYAVYPVSRIIRGGEFKDHGMAPIILFIIFSKPLLFSDLIPPCVLTQFIFIGYLANLVTTFFPLYLCLPIFTADLLLGSVIMHYSESPCFPESVFLLYTFITLIAAIISTASLQNFRRIRTLYDRSRHAVSEFVKVNMKIQDNVDRSSFEAMHKERERISREVHDTVGYTLTALLLQIQANQEVVRAGETSAVILKRLMDQENMIRDAITDVREEIRNLRSEPKLNQNGKVRWDGICRVFAESTGIRIITNISDNLAIVSDRLSDNIYRIIQEALTNSYRHGNADYIDVSMKWDRAEAVVYLRISDNGVGCYTYEMGTGMRSMRERIIQLKGDIFWQSQPNKGFDIGITIPWRGVEIE